MLGILRKNKFAAAFLALALTLSIFSAITPAVSADTAPEPAGEDPQSFTVGTADENLYKVDEYNACAPEGGRYHDNDAYTTYKFTYADGYDIAALTCDIAAQWKIEASADGEHFTVAAHTAKAITDEASADVIEHVTVDLTPYMTDTKTIYVKFADYYPENGWGGYIHSTAPVTFKVSCGKNVQSFTVGTAGENLYKVDEYNACAPEGGRYHDNDAYTTYRFTFRDGDNKATLTCDIAAQWKIEASPDGEHFTVAAHTAKAITDEALGNVIEHVTVDLTPYMTDTKTIYVKFADYYPENGWGGYIHSTAPVTFTSEKAETTEPNVQSFTVGTEDEGKYKTDEYNACAPEGGRYHDNDAYTTYRFTFRDSDNKATLTCDIAAQWKIEASPDGESFTVAAHTAKAITDEASADVVEHVTVDLTPYMTDTKTIYVKFADYYPENGWGGYIHSTAPVTFTSEKEETTEPNVQSFTVGTEDEGKYKTDEYNACAPEGGRYHDNDAYTTYRFTFRDGDNKATLTCDIAAQWKIEASPDGESFTVAAHTAKAITDEASADVVEHVTVDLTPYMTDTKTIYVKFADYYPENGWGGYIHSTAPVTFTSEYYEVPEVPEGAELTLSFTVGTEDENKYKFAEYGACAPAGGRYHDNDAYTVYKFSVPDGYDHGLLTFDIAAQWKVDVSTDGVNFRTLAHTAKSVSDEASADVVEHVRIDVSDMLDKTAKDLYVRFCDCYPENGWGGYIHSTAPVSLTVKNGEIENGGSNVETVDDGIKVNGDEMTQSFTVGTATERLFIDSESGACAPVGGRYHDNDAYTVYKFSFPEGYYNGLLKLDIAAQWKIEASTDGENYTTLAQTAKSPSETASSDDVERVQVNMDKYFNGEPVDIYVRISDRYPENGWGAYIHSTKPVTFIAKTGEIEDSGTRAVPLGGDGMTVDDVSMTYSFFVGTSTELTYRYAEYNACAPEDGRYHDNDAYTVYKFNFPAGYDHALLKVHIAAQWAIDVSVDGKKYTTVAQTSRPEDQEALAVEIECVQVNLSKYFNGSDPVTLYVRFRDAYPKNGWGGYIRKTAPITVMAKKGVIPNGETKVTPYVMDEGITSGILGSYRTPKIKEYDSQGNKVLVAKNCIRISEDALVVEFNMPLSDEGISHTWKSLRWAKKTSEYDVNINPGGAGTVQEMAIGWEFYSKDDHSRIIVYFEKGVLGRWLTTGNIYALQGYSPTFSMEEVNPESGHSHNYLSDVHSQSGKLLASTRHAPDDAWDGVYMHIFVDYGWTPSSIPADPDWQRDGSIYGDADGSGAVDAFDITVIAQYLVGGYGIESIDETICDVDGSGAVDAFDITVIAQYLAGGYGINSLEPKTKTDTDDEEEAVYETVTDFSVTESTAKAKKWLFSYLSSGKPLFSCSIGGTEVKDISEQLEMTVEKKVTDGTCEEYRIKYLENGSGILFTTTAVLYGDSDTIDVVTEVENTRNANSPVLSDLYAVNAVLTVPRNGVPAVLHTSEGALVSYVNDEYDYALVTKEMAVGGKYVFAPDGGRSSDEAWPYFDIMGDGCGAMIAIGWTGQWEASFEMLPNDRIGFTARQQYFNAYLEPCEKVRTPSAVISFFDGDAADGHNVLRKLMIDHYSPDVDAENYPLCFNVRSNKTTIETSAYNFIDRGVEDLTVWLDAEWYGNRDNWVGEAGNWYPKPDVYPGNTFSSVSEFIHSAGYRFMLWIEPERASTESGIVVERPELFSEYNVNGKKLLRLDTEEGYDWMKSLIVKAIEEWGIDNYRQDFNMKPLEYWLHNDGENRIGISENHHITNLYRLLDELLAEYPDLIIDNCSSGGRRLDIEMSKRTICLLATDYVNDASTTEGAQFHTQNLAYWYPLASSGVYTADSDYWDDYKWKSSLNISTVLRLAESDTAVYAAELFKSMRKYYFGEYYQLLEPSYDMESWQAWEFFLPDENEGTAMIISRPESLEIKNTIKLCGLDDETVYTVSDYEDAGTILAQKSGLVLKTEGIEVENMPGTVKILKISADH